MAALLSASEKADIAVLDGFDTEQLTGLIDILLDFVAQTSSEEDMRDSIATFATDYGVNQNALWKVVRSTLGLFKEGVRCQMASNTLQDVLSGAGVRDEKAELVAGKYQEQLGALTAAMIDKTLVVNKLVDMEWKFGVTASNSDMRKVGSTFIQIKLVVDKGGNVGKQDIHMELSLEQFFVLLEQMKKAQSQLEQLT